MVILFFPFFFHDSFLCVAYSLYSHPSIIYHAAISTVPSPFLAGKPLEHLCIAAARLHSGTHSRHLSSFVLTFICPCPVWSPICNAHCNETRGGESEVNNLIKLCKKGQRWEMRIGLLWECQQRKTHRWQRGSQSSDVALCPCHPLILVFIVLLLLLLSMSHVHE